MADLLIRDLSDELLAAVTERAKADGHALSDVMRDLLRRYSEHRDSPASAGARGGRARASRMAAPELSEQGRRAVMIRHLKQSLELLKLRSLNVGEPVVAEGPGDLLNRITVHVEGIPLSYADVRTLGSGAMELYELPESLGPLYRLLRECAHRTSHDVFAVDVDEICGSPGLSFLPSEPAIWTGLDGRGAAIQDVVERVGLQVLSMQNDVIRFRRLESNAAMFIG